MTRLAVATLACLGALVATPVHAQSLAGKKVLFVNSYHQGYAWSDGEEAGAAQSLAGSGVKLDFYRMDLKRHTDEKWYKDESQKVKALIESSKPDVVIVSDDLATKVMVANFKNTAQPWVFCGVNWDSSVYGLPFSNATGMNEVALTEQLLESLKAYAKGNRIAFLTVDSETERTEGRYYKKQLKLQFVQEKYVKTLAEWKDAFKKIQDEADVLLLGNFAGINDWNEASAAAFVLENAKIPSGGMYDFMMPYSMIGMTKIAEEQGIWAGKTTLSILKGSAPSSIPVAANKQAKLYANVKLASKAGIVFKPELIRNAEVIK
jgi:ABC-type uncharacterized transport system substrate-binding protein